MRAVLDTNVIISGLGWPGRERELLLMAALGRYELIISYEILKELIGVLQSGNFKQLESKKILRLINILFEISAVVTPKRHHEAIIDDPDDNIVLDCGVEAKADYIVSGDSHLLKLKEFKGIYILKPSEFERIVLADNGR